MTQNASTFPKLPAIHACVQLLRYKALAKKSGQDWEPLKTRLEALDLVAKAEDWLDLKAAQDWFWGGLGRARLADVFLSAIACKRNHSPRCIFDAVFMWLAVPENLRLVFFRAKKRAHCFFPIVSVGGKNFFTSRLESRALRAHFQVQEGEAVRTSPMASWRGGHLVICSKPSTVVIAK